MQLECIKLAAFKIEYIVYGVAILIICIMHFKGIN
jgi:hypothetical protein